MPSPGVDNRNYTIGLRWEHFGPVRWAMEHQQPLVLSEVPSRWFVSTQRCQGPWGLVALPEHLYLQGVIQPAGLHQARSLQNDSGQTAHQVRGNQAGTHSLTLGHNAVTSLGSFHEGITYISNIQKGNYSHK